MDLLMAYHVDRYHPSDRSLLRSLAVMHGIFPTEEKVDAWLDGNELDMEVRRAYLTAHRLGVHGVPFFVFQGKWAASGAMGVDEFVTVSQFLLILFWAVLFTSFRPSTKRYRSVVVLRLTVEVLVVRGYRSKR